MRSRKNRNLSLTTKVYILEKNLFIIFFPHSHPLTGRTWCGGLPTSCWPWWSPPSSSCPRPRPRPSWSPQGHHEVGRSPHQVHPVRDWLCWEKLIKRFFSKIYTLLVRERFRLNLCFSLTQKRNLSLTTKVYILEKNLFINFFPHSHPLTGRTWCGGLPTSWWPWWSPPPTTPTQAFLKSSRPSWSGEIATPSASS